MSKLGTREAYRWLLVSIAFLSFSSLFWWSWAFGHMIVGYEVCFKEPNPTLAFIEFLVSGSAALTLLVIIKKEIKKKL
jgi:hypothetical protein